jgi:hypothetical protein
VKFELVIKNNYVCKTRNKENKHFLFQKLSINLSSYFRVLHSEFAFFPSELHKYPSEFAFQPSENQKYPSEFAFFPSELQKYPSEFAF